MFRHAVAHFSSTEARGGDRGVRRIDTHAALAAPRRPWLWTHRNQNMSQQSTPGSGLLRFRVADSIRTLAGVDEVLDPDDQRRLAIDHAIRRPCGDRRTRRLVLRRRATRRRSRWGIQRHRRNSWAPTRQRRRVPGSHQLRPTLFPYQTAHLSDRGASTRARRTYSESLATACSRRSGADRLTDNHVEAGAQHLIEPNSTPR